MMEPEPLTCVKAASVASGASRLCSLPLVRSAHPPEGVGSAHQRSAPPSCAARSGRRRRKCGTLPSTGALVPKALT